MKPLNDRIQCLICGKWYIFLASHVWQTHGWTVDDYREEFGLNRGTPLCSQSYSDMHRDKCLRLNLVKNIEPYFVTSETSQMIRPKSIILRREAREAMALRYPNPSKGEVAREKIKQKARLRWDNPRGRQLQAERARKQWQEIPPDRRSVLMKALNPDGPWNKGSSSRLTINCDYCGASREIYPSELKRDRKHHFCNHSCSAKFYGLGKQIRGNKVAPGNVLSEPTKQRSEGERHYLPK